MKRLFFGLLLVLSIIPIAQVATAHGYIVRAIPENRAVLERAPTRLQYWFSEALEREFSAVNVRDQEGEIIATGGVDEADDTLMAVRLPSDLPDGAYVVELRPAFASDGHVVAESRVFFVGEEVGGIAGAAAETQARPLEVVWRAVTLSAVMLLFGVFTLYTAVLVPAWGNPAYPAGLLPPRVMKRLNVIVGYALLVAFAGNLLALVQQTMVFFNIGFLQALDPGFISLVRIGSRFGDIWNWRMMFLGLVGAMFLASLYFRDAYPQTVRAFWVANAWMMALVIGSFSVLSHAAGSLLWPWVGITVDWMHALGVGLWAGGVAALVMVLPRALTPYVGDQRRLALLTVLRRFSPFAAAAVFLVIATGLYSASNWFYTPADVATPFGLALGVKLALAALLIGLGALHHAALRPERFQRFAGWTHHLTFTPTLRLEAAAVLLVLVAVGWLSATPVPVPAFAQREVEAPVQAKTAGDLTVVLSLLPGGPGVNTYDTTITRDGQRVEGLDVRLRITHPARDERGVWHRADLIEPGLYVTAGDEIDAAGRWWALMDVAGADDDDETRRLAFEWDISEEAAVIDSLDPNTGNLAALAAVLIAVGVVITPYTRRIYGLLNLDAGSVTIALGATAATVLALAVGFAVVQNTRQTYAETLNPPPEVVNAVLPTQASLERGAALFQTACAGWQSEPRDLDALKERLPRTRDEELYFAVVEGWRDLPPCTESGQDGLSLYDKWDIVNFFRTFEAVD